MSAWIEINQSILLRSLLMRRTLCECVDWNHLQTHAFLDHCQSHSLWVRGLKSVRSPCKLTTGRSHSLWVRGLKFHSHLVNHHSAQVALFVSAWIEISLSNSVLPFCQCRTLCECVDWNKLTVMNKKLYRKSHSLWVRGLKSNTNPQKYFLLYVALFVSAWIEISY